MYHLNVETDYLSWEKLVPEWLLLPVIGQVVFQLLAQLEEDLLAFLHIYQCQRYCTSENPLPPGVEYFKPSLGV